MQFFYFYFIYLLFYLFIYFICLFIYFLFFLFLLFFFYLFIFFFFFFFFFWRFALLLFFLYISIFWCLGKTVLRDCGMFSASSLIHYEIKPIQMYWEFQLPPKNENFQMKHSGSFHISALNIDCGYLLEPPHRGGSNKYPQSMFLSRNKKNNVYPCKAQFYYIKAGFKGVKIIYICFRDVYIVRKSA